MKKTLKELESQARKTGGAALDISNLYKQDAILELVRNPHSGELHYFDNNQKGRKEINRSEADQIVRKLYK